MITATIVTIVWGIVVLLAGGALIDSISPTKTTDTTQAIAMTAVLLAGPVGWTLFAAAAVYVALGGD
jgi:hypothetical protein